MQFEPRLTPRISEIKSLKQFELYWPPAVHAPGRLGPREYEFFQHSDEVPFEPNVSGYSAANAWYLSDLAYLAYTDCPTTAEVEGAVAPVLARMFRSSPSVKAFLGSAKRRGKTDLKDPIQCIVAHDASVGVVAFRGTLPQSNPNWLTDADLVPTRERGTGAHACSRGVPGSLGLCVAERSA